MTEKSKPKSQADKFKDAAREVDADDEEKRFDEKLKKVAKSRPAEEKENSANQAGAQAVGLWAGTGRSHRSIPCGIGYPVLGQEPEHQVPLDRTSGAAVTAAFMASFCVPEGLDRRSFRHAVIAGLPA
jgi:hypothetical protein